jgi:hypothetical protein
MSYDPGQGQQVPGQSLAASEATLYQSVGTAPTQARRKPRRWLWISLIIGALVLAGAITTAIILIVIGPSRAVNSVVQNYYTAVEQQDYTTAYTYLDKQFITSTGVQINLTQTEYTISASTNDLVDGKLTAFTIASITVDNNTAEATANVTRGGNTRQVDLQLQQVDGSWEIDKIAQA